MEQYHAAQAFLATIIATRNGKKGDHWPVVPSMEIAEAIMSELPVDIARSLENYVTGLLDARTK